MTETDPRLAVRLHRLEVHLAAPSDGFPDTDWRVWAEGDSDSILVVGYLASSSPDGYGQAQVTALVLQRSISDVLSSETAQSEFIGWVKAYVTETMYDVARRALQGQAAQMDFSLPLPLKAPEVTIAVAAAADA